MPTIRSATGETASFARRLRVGRAEGNDLRLALPTISGDHAVFEQRAEGLFVRDLGSTNGTRVRGRTAVGWIRLGVGDTVRFGPDSAWDVTAVDERPEQGSARYTVVALPSGRAISMVEDRFVIGSRPDADLRLEGDGVPDVAAVIACDDDALRLVRLDEHGSWPAAERGLEAGNTFEVSGTRLRIEDDAGGRRTFTAPEGVSPRHYDLDLRLVPTGPGEGRIELDSGELHLSFDGVPNRYVLLLVLARACRSATEEPGEAWVDDDDLRVALWGRSGANARYTTALGKVIYDTRRMIAARGLDPFFIEKSRGRTRLRLKPDHVAIEGE